MHGRGERRRQRIRPALALVCAGWFEVVGTLRIVPSIQTGIDAGVRQVTKATSTTLSTQDPAGNDTAGKGPVEEKRHRQ